MLWPVSRSHQCGPSPVHGNRVATKHVFLKPSIVWLSAPIVHRLTACFCVLHPVYATVSESQRSGYTGSRLSGDCPTNPHTPPTLVQAQAAVPGTKKSRCYHHPGTNVFIQAPRPPAIWHHAPPGYSLCPRRFNGQMLIGQRAPLVTKLRYMKLPPSTNSAPPSGPTMTSEKLPRKLNRLWVVGVVPVMLFFITNTSTIASHTRLLTEVAEWEEMTSSSDK